MKTTLFTSALTAITLLSNVSGDGGIHQHHRYAQEAVTGGNPPSPLGINARVRESRLFPDATSSYSSKPEAAATCVRQTRGRHKNEDHTNNGNNSDNKKVCQTPKVPLELFGRQPYCRKLPCHKRETCLIVAENVLAHYGKAFDVVFLTAGMCQVNLSPGNLTHAMVQKMLPTQEKLVGLMLNGTDLVAALEQGLSKPSSPRNEIDVRETCSVPLPSFMYENCKKTPIATKQNLDHFPAVAGVKFGVDKDYKLYNVRVFSATCEWVEIDLQGSYSVLTTESLVLGSLQGRQQQYAALTTSFRYYETGNILDQIFWKQALATCTVQQPVPHLLLDAPSSTSCSQQLQEEQQQQQQGPKSLFSPPKSHHWNPHLHGGIYRDRQARILNATQIHRLASFHSRMTTV